ncbi:hypothetical protein MRS76_19240 [Rhizobiaceae bacterium n13]|uniref:hypothetical protein n=1 Tax=Ferirhizobium litorale TaxID=2927786 RepID=UPI0024B2D879|nr:hypothetical protein [Fererhizobium litorale]MDI7864087.1 hypothetical protein [Fererhizobium litorale]
MTVYATAGAKLYIGGVKAQQSTDFIASDFSAEVWVEVEEVEGLGSVGDTSEAISFTSLGDSRTRTFKGPRSAGAMEVVMGIDPADAGQVALIAAEKTKFDYAFRIVLNDAPQGGTPSERLFIAKVMSQAEQFDQANNIMKLNASLGVNSNIVRINAAA